MASGSRRLSGVTSGTLELAVRGAADQRSFASFVGDTASSMHRTAVLLCGDHHLAEDLTQATYAKVFASWGRVVAANDPVAYTRTMLVRTFLSHRRLRRTSERPTEDLPEAGRPADDPALRLDLLAALRTLSADDRAVLVLRYWEDRSVAETARLTGTSEAACRKRTSRALQRVRLLLPHLDPTDPADRPDHEE
jgi:RNA polymerase sigma-70 factor (sigma-E family)